MRITIGIAAVALLSVAGCGGEDEPSKNREEIQRAVQTFSDAFLTGDSETSYDMLSSRCQERMGDSGWRLVVESANEMYGSEMEIQNFDADVAGDMARVTYEFPVSAINQDSEPWTMEDGEWKVDDC